MLKIGKQPGEVSGSLDNRKQLLRAQQIVEYFLLYLDVLEENTKEFLNQNADEIISVLRNTTTLRKKRPESIYKGIETGVTEIERAQLLVRKSFEGTIECKIIKIKGKKQSKKRTVEQVIDWLVNNMESVPIEVKNLHEVARQEVIKKLREQEPHAVDEQICRIIVDLRTTQTIVKLAFQRPLPPQSHKNKPERKAPAKREELRVANVPHQTAEETITAELILIPPRDGKYPYKISLEQEWQLKYSGLVEEKMAIIDERYPLYKQLMAKNNENTGTQIKKNDPAGDVIVLFQRKGKIYDKKLPRQALVEID